LQVGKAEEDLAKHIQGGHGVAIKWDTLAAQCALYNEEEALN